MPSFLYFFLPCVSSRSPFHFSPVVVTIVVAVITVDQVKLKRYCLSFTGLVVIMVVIRQMRH